jgi:hypothetical protein
VAGFRNVARQGDPPLPVNVLECLPNLQSRKILQWDWAECEQGDKKAVAHTPVRGEIGCSEFLRFGHQC